MKKKCCNNSITDDEAKEVLTNSGLNRTKAKVSTLMILSQSKTPLSVSDIYEGMGRDKCDLSTIHRTIGQLKDKGIVREINLGEDFARFELINTDEHHHDHHHHHVRCRDCGDIKIIEKCDISIFEKAIARLGFKNMEHFVEFTGTCSKCS